MKRIGSWCLSLAFVSGAALGAVAPATNFDPWHRTLWKRFVGHDGVLLDYAGPAGEVDIPTAEDCRAGKPNALGWWSPIENGAFFTGLALAGQCQRARLTGNPKDVGEARVLARGLLFLARETNHPGFIARGYSEDGTACHAVSSADQVGPWFYGLDRYLQSGIPSEDEKKSIIASLERIAEALEKGAWQIPTGPGMAPGQNFGTWNWKDFRSVPRLLFVCRALHHWTGKQVWLDRYREYARAIPFRASVNRLAILAEGMPRDVRGEDPALAENSWIYVVSQAMCAALLEREDDPEFRAALRASLEATAGQVQGLLGDVRYFRALPVSMDWRKLGFWAPQATPKEAERIAVRQLPDWTSPGRMFETRFMREPLCAAWISAFSTNQAFLGRTLWTLETARGMLDPVGFSGSVFFMGECAWMESLTKGHEAIVPQAPPKPKPAQGTPDWIDDRDIPPWLGARFAPWSPTTTRCSDKFRIVSAPPLFERGIFLTVSRGMATLPPMEYSVGIRRRATAYLVVHAMGGFQPDSSWQKVPETLSWCPHPAATNRDSLYLKQLGAGEYLVIPSHPGRGETSYGIPHACLLIPQ